MKVILCEGQSFLSNDKRLTDFILSTIREMCTEQSGQTFIGLSFANVPMLPEVGSTQNILLKPPAFAALWKQSWQTKQIAAIIKNEQPAGIVCIDGSSIKTTVPQCALIANENDLLFKKPDFWVYIITFSEYLRQLLVEKGYQPERITIIRPVALSSFVPLDWDTREAIKRKYAQEAEYFFFNTNKTNPAKVLNVLKAFSIFKKWQKSTARLLIYLTDNTLTEQWMKLLPSYKFRDDVVVQQFTNNEEQALITASAMCMLYFPDMDATGIDLLGCIQVQVPAITHNNGAIQETIGDGALYCNADDVEEIAERMKKIYRDEKLRSQLMQALVKRAETRTENSAANRLWNAIEQVFKGALPA